MRLRLKYEREQAEARTIFSITTKQSIFMTFASYIDFKDYFTVSTINKRMNEELRSTIGAKSLIVYFKQYKINRQPLCTVNVKYPMNGGQNMHMNGNGNGGGHG